MNRGKIIIVLCVVLLSIQIASADTLNLTASTNETFADNRTVWIVANLTNTGHPINDTRVNFTADCGILSAGYNYTNASGIAVMNISSWDLCTAKITAEAPNAANATVNVTFVRGPISQIVLSADSSGTVNTIYLVTATVYDKTRDEFANNKSRWRVMPNVTLNFKATSPPPNQWNSPDEDYNASVSPSPSTTDENGTTTVTMHLSSRAGTNYIDVNVTNEDGEEVTEYLVIVGLAGEAITLTVTTSPENVSANGIDLSHVTGKVTDGFGNPLLSTGAIRFNVTGSDPIRKPLNSVGEATISIGPSKFTGSVAVNGTYINVTGDYTNITGSATVIFYADEPARVVVRADATRISTSKISGVNISTITATVIDKWGHTLPGRTVAFNLTGPGNLSSATGTADSRGQVMITLQSDTAGDATVAAKSLNDSGYELEGSIVIHIMGDPFISVITTIEPDPIEPGGIINVTTSVSGQGNITGTRLAAHAMLTLDRSGSMDPDYYAGTPLDVALVLDRSGSMEYLGSNPEQPMTDAKTAAKVFMDNLVSNAQVGVVSFSSDHRVDIGLTLLNSSDDKALIRNAIDGIAATGGTAIGDGLADANNMLIGGRVDARKITILLTDGVCNAGNDQDCSNAISVANTNHITIYTIGLGSAEYIDEPLLQRVSSETGGRYYNAPSSSELRGVYNSIAQEISDYDITEIEYGTEGFTPYDYETESSIDLKTYSLRFGGYDLDYTGDCRIEVNGALLTEIPNPSSGNEQWKDDYEYDITALVQNGTNVISFYDPKDYTNAIRNVVILANNITIAQYPAEVNLVDDYPYNCTFNTSYYSFEDTFLINETINDLKVLVNWENTTTDLNLRLTSPSRHVYGAGDDTTGYYFDDREAVPIDLRAPEFDTYIASASLDTVFADATSFYVTDDGAGGEQTSSIMRWKLPSAPTNNARIESVTMYLRGITPTSNPGTEHRSVNIYDLTTSYGDDPTWNRSDDSASQAWTSGSFSSADNDSYLIDSVALSASISDQVVEFNITSANWSGSRLPDWGKECSIVLTGSGYGGAGADRFASSETNPNSHTYRLNGYRPLVTVTYSIPRDTSEYIWIHPLPYTYPATDADTVENGNWTVQVTGSGAGSEQFNITTYIDKKSAAKLASHAFISSLNPVREDRVGLATYSYSSTNNTTVQSSYVQEGGQWEGYFAIVDRSGTVNSTSWSVTSPDYPGNYPNYYDNTWIKTVSGASQIRVHFTEIDVESSYDYIYIYDGGDNLVTSYTNTGAWPGNALTDVWAPWVDGDTIKIRLKTDNYVPGWWGGHYYSLSGFQTNLIETQKTSPFTFSITYPQPNNLTFSLYQGITLLNSSNTSIIPTLDEDVTYHIIVNGTDVSSNDTNFTLTSSESVNWLEWRAHPNNPLSDSIVSFNPINTSIDALTADGMTAIDEGLYEANNALYDYFAAVSKPVENGTIILMTDGIDNVGYHSMIAEAERAAANNTTIFTVGFGSTIDDRVLRQIANITGGEYYFAPNATVLKNIFVGIAGVLGNFTAPEPRIDIQIGNNATVEGAFANVTYINDSAIVTYFNCTLADCSEGQYEYEHPSNPNVAYIGNRTILTWDIGNRPDRVITVGKYWNVTYQLRIDNESAGYVPIVLYPSCVTYEGAGGEGNCSNNLVPDANVDVVGNGTNVSTNPAKYIDLANKAVSGGPPFRLSSKSDTVQEYAYRLTASLEDKDESPVAFGAVVEFKATSGTLYNYTLHNTSGLLNGTTELKGDAIVWLSSNVPGTITVCAYHTTANGTELTPACNVVIFHSLESPPIIPPAPRPRGVITLESDPFADWLSLLWQNR